MNEDLEKRIQEIEANIGKTKLQNKEPTKLYFFEPDLNSFFKEKQSKIKLANHIFLARVVVSLASAFALWKYPEYWFVSGPILIFAVMFGGMIEGLFVASENRKK
jgi:hypothetical protein